MLARIDARDYAVALDQARADVAAARAVIASKQAAISVQRSNAESVKATILVDRSNEAFAEQESRRYAYLARTGFGSVQNAQQAASRIAAALAGIQRDEAVLASTVALVGLQEAELAQALAALAHSRAVQNQAELNLVNLRLLRRRNFGVGVVANVLVGFTLFETVYIMPQYLPQMQRYNAEQIGSVLAWTGLPQLLLIPFVPWLIKRFDVRYVGALGISILGL